jgi:hypothetical protein
MQVIATPEAQAFIAARGGVAYVRSLQRKCCGGALTVLAATTTPPADAGCYQPVGDPELGVRYRRPGSDPGLPAASYVSSVAGVAGGTTASSVAGAHGGTMASQPATLVRQKAEPAELLIELRGRRRPRLVACWDGCAFKI